MVEAGDLIPEGAKRNRTYSIKKNKPEMKTKTNQRKLLIYSGMFYFLSATAKNKTVAL